ncbi:hypothetical protein M6B38_381700 [Iris pallida]|uniref:Uncharacterized protein n=1 Tax=Iris pallida TaxID=29817 RepID=A0AAX6G781_IRIPA|nr:hypothetical protein M6B38_381700 [Iris pallida]
MAREAHAERARRTKENKEVWRRSSFPNGRLCFLGPKQCFVSWPNQGFGASCYI